MPAPLDELERGVICIALYPFSPDFPIELVVRETEDALTAELDRTEDIETVARRVEHGSSKKIVVEVKLRPVLLLQSGTDPRRLDVLAARISSITDTHRERRAAWVRKLESHAHPVHYAVGAEEHHGLRHSSYVNLLDVAPLRKATILRRLGTLTEEEMADVSERLIRSLELDVSRYIRALAPTPTPDNPEARG